MELFLRFRLFMHFARGREVPVKAGAVGKIPLKSRVNLSIKQNQSVERSAQTHVICGEFVHY